MESNQIKTSQLYMLELDNLEVGDIILESGSSKFSWWIRKGTGSEYSHVMLYVGHSIIHALTDGVYSGNPQRMLVNSQTDLKVLRLKDREEGQINGLVDNARKLIGSLYSIPEAISAPIKKDTKLKSKTSAQYCSKLIASVYADTGISLVKNQDYCSPEDINKSKLLIEVKDCVRKASIDELEFAKSNNPILENQISTFKYLSDCRKLFKKVDIDIQSETDVPTALIQHRELDSLVCTSIRKSGYLDHYNSDELINPYRYNIQLFLERYGENKVKGYQVLESEFGSLSSILERHLNNYEASKAMYFRTELEYYHLFIGLYENILLSSRNWLNTLILFAQEIEEIYFENLFLEILKKIDNTISIMKDSR